MAGRPKKGSNPKKVELNAEQKRYSAIVKEVQELTELKQERINKLQEKIKDLQEEQTTLQNEVNNLRGIRTSAENILASKPAPPEWEKFCKHVYEYHYHYYPNTPIYFGPWWYYTTSGTLNYPTWQTITTPYYGGNGNYSMNVTNAQSGNFSLSNAQTQNFTMTTNAGSLPSVVPTTFNINGSNSLALASSSFNGSVLMSNGPSAPSFVDASAGSGSTVFCSSIASDATAPPMTSWTMDVNLTNGSGSAYTPTAEQVAESVGFLNSIGWITKEKIDGVEFEMPKN